MSRPPASLMTAVAQTTAVVRRVRPAGPRQGGETAAGAYRRYVLDVPAAAGISAAARPGHLAVLTDGGPGSATVVPRPCFIHRVISAQQIAGAARGLDPLADPTREPMDQLEIVVAESGAGTQWPMEITEGTQLDIVAPLGRPFPLPTEPVACILVGDGPGSAPLFWLAEVLAERGCRVDIVLGAATSSRLFGVDLAQEVAASVVVTTRDGTLGVPGTVSDVLPEVLGATDAVAVYACGPMETLRAVTDTATAHGAVAQVAVEGDMACGIGICMTCAIPVVGPGGVTSMVRACVGGPVFRGDRIRWDAFTDGRCEIPGDAVGAPETVATTAADDAPAVRSATSAGDVQ